MRFLSALVILWSFSAGAGNQIVPEIHISGLAPSMGQNLSVFYVMGRLGIIQSKGQDLSARQVFATQTQRITGPTLIIPSTPVQTPGFQIVNYVVFATHNQPSLFLKRPDGDIVNDPRIQGQSPPDSDFQATSAKYISVDDLLALRKSGQFIPVDFSKDLH